MMRITLILSVCLCCCMVITSQAQAPPRDDQQFWHETQFIKPLTERADLMIAGVLRAGRARQRPVDERIGAGVKFKLNQYLSFTPLYFYVDQQPFAGRRINEHRLIADLTVKVRLGKFTLTNRNRYEHRIRHRERDFEVYRNRLLIDHPAKLGSFTFKPFVGSEVFYSSLRGNDLRRQGWSRARYLGGVNKQFNERLYGELFYVRQQDGFSRPGNVHAIGTLLRVLL